MCGSLTGLTIGTIIHPLELIRTHLAVNVRNVTAEIREKPSVMSTAADLYIKEGIPGLYKGVCSSCVAMAPFVGLKMIALNFITISLIPSHRFLSSLYSPELVPMKTAYPVTLLSLSGAGQVTTTSWAGSSSKWSCFEIILTVGASSDSGGWPEVYSLVVDQSPLQY